MDGLDVIINKNTLTCIARAALYPTAAAVLDIFNSPYKDEDIARLRELSVPFPLFLIEALVIQPNGDAKAYTRGACMVLRDEVGRFISREMTADTPLAEDDEDFLPEPSFLPVFK